MTVYIRIKTRLLRLVSVRLEKLVQDFLSANFERAYIADGHIEKRPVFLGYYLKTRRFFNRHGLSASDYLLRKVLSQRMLFPLEERSVCVVFHVEIEILRVCARHGYTQNLLRKNRPLLADPRDTILSVG